MRSVLLLTDTEIDYLVALAATEHIARRLRARAVYPVLGTKVFDKSPEFNDVLNS